MRKLILASSSPRRKKLLEENGFVFEVKAAEIDEDSYLNLSPLEMVKLLSKLKAEKIARSNPLAIILGADTTIDLNGKTIGKPKDKDQAREILRSLSGSRHKVITAFTIISDRTSSTFYEETQVIFNNLTSEQIEAYIGSYDVLGFAGAYGIQDGADKFVKKIKGDLLNVIGLPSIALKKLDALGVK